MRHYYSDEGLLQYEVEDRGLLVELAKAFEPMEEKDFAQYRLKTLYEASNIMCQYSIHKNLVGLGGCISVDTWRKEIPSDPVEAAVKLLFLDFITMGFIPNEFLLVALDTLHQLQITYLLD